MKIFIFATVLTVALFANIAKADDNVTFKNEAEKQEYTDEVLQDLEKNVDKKCLPSLKKDVFPAIRASAVKHIVRIVKGNPIYADKDREFDFFTFIEHSEAYKNWIKHESTCVKSFLKGAKKAIVSGFKRFGNWLKKMGKAITG